MHFRPFLVFLAYGFLSWKSADPNPPPLLVENSTIFFWNLPLLSWLLQKKQHFNFQFSHSTLTSSFNINFPFKHQTSKSKSSLKVSFNCQLQMLVSNFKFIYIYTSILNSNIILHQFKLQIQSSNSIFSFQP